MKQFFSAFLPAAMLVAAAFGAEAQALTQRTVHMTGTPTTMIKNEVSTRTPAVLYGLGLNRLATTVKAPARAAEIQTEVIVDEDFSRFTEGTNDEPKIDPNNPIADMLPEGYMQGDAFLADSWTAQPGWWGMGIYQAGGACALAYPRSGGYISTPIRNYAGHLVITFRMMSLTGNTTGTNVTVGIMKNATAGFPTPLYAEACRVEPGEDWKEFTIVYDCEDMTEECAVQWNASYQPGVLLDDVKIVRDNSFVAKPIGLDFDITSATSFTASWSPAYGGDNYEVEIYSETAVGTENVNIEETFETAGVEADGILTLPSGVTIEGGEIVEGLSADGTKSLKITGNVVVTTPYNGGLIEDSEFDIIIRPQDVETGDGVMYYWGYDGSRWINYASTEYAWYPVNEPYVDSMEGHDQWAPQPISGRYYQQRYEFRNIPENAPLYLDNIKMETTSPAEKKPFGENIITKETTLTVTDLDPEEDYFFRVRSLADNGNQSDWSDRKGVFGQAAPVALPATEPDPRGGFTANWEETPKAQRYQVKTYKVHTAIEDELVEVLHETFEDVTDMGTLDNYFRGENYYEPYSLDEYTDMPGWNALFVGLADGYVGIAYGGFGMGEISSPELNLSALNGTFSVTVKGVGTPTDAMIVQCDQTAYKEITIGADGTFEGTVTFDCGTATSQLIFYSKYDQAIFISEVEVTQSLKAGESSLAMVDDSGMLEGKTTTTYRVSGLEPIDEDSIDYYAYTVTASRVALHNTYTSTPSEMIAVDINADNGQGGIDTLETDAKPVRFFDLQGRPVVAPTNGFFIGVDAEGNAVKMVR